jgi:hypothetical protein
MLDSKVINNFSWKNFASNSSSTKSTSFAMVAALFFPNWTWNLATGRSVLQMVKKIKQHSHALKSFWI